jgi:DNA-3-methyladenine glycosylase II
VGDRDPIVADLQRSYRYMRPTLFHSPYEAAAVFVIGHRISIVHSRQMRMTLSRELGEPVDVRGEPFSAFPTPQRVLAVTECPGISDTKIERLHAIARAALDGWLDRAYLRSLGEEAALVKLQTLPGVGPFFAYA